MFLRHLFSAKSRSVSKEDERTKTRESLLPQAQASSNTADVPTEIVAGNRSETTNRGKFCSATTTPVSSGPTSLVMVMGDNGVGKSALTAKLNAFAHTVQNHPPGSVCPEDQPLRFVEWDPLTAQSVSRISQLQLQMEEQQRTKKFQQLKKSLRRSRGKTTPNNASNSEKLLPAEILCDDATTPLPSDCCAIRIPPQDFLLHEDKKNIIQEGLIWGEAARNSAVATICAPRNKYPSSAEKSNHAPLTQDRLEAHRKRMNSRRPPPLLGIRDISNLPKQHQEKSTAIDASKASFTEKLGAPSPSPTPKHQEQTSACSTRLHVQAFILCYDIGCSDSFFRLVSDFLLQVQKLSGLKGAKVFIVGTKKDTSNPRREVLPEQGLALAHSVGGFFLETSATSGTGCEELFTALAFAKLDG